MPVFLFKKLYKNQTVLPKTRLCHSTRKTQLFTFFTRAYVISIGCIRYLWCEYNQRAALVEEGAAMPHSGLSFIIAVLLAFAGMKSQCHPGFPFITHPRQVRLSINSVLMYAFSWAAEVIASGLDCGSVFAGIARLGKICSLCVFVTSLVSLLYF